MDETYSQGVFIPILWVLGVFNDGMSSPVLFITANVDTAVSFNEVVIADITEATLKVHTFYFFNCVLR